MYRAQALSLTLLLLAGVLSACGVAGGSSPSTAGRGLVAESAATVDAQEVAQIAARAEVVVLEPRPPGEDDVVCRREHVTGTHRPREICQTAAQRRATRSAAQDWVRSGGRTGDVSRVPTVR